MRIYNFWKWKMVAVTSDDNTSFDQSFGGIVEKMAEFLFFPIANIPVIVWVLMLGAIFFTIYHNY